MPTSPILDRRSHWEDVYAAKSPETVSWFQESPAPSLELIVAAAPSKTARIVDIGGGASRLVDALIREGYRDPTVLDLSSAAIKAARIRLGTDAGCAEWITADVTTWSPSRRYDVWHDRAAFHFLTEPGDQNAYVKSLRAALPPGGHVIIGTFALDGPERCSNLPVVRHNANSIAAVLGRHFALLDEGRYDHPTPWGAVQKFQFSTFKSKRDPMAAGGSTRRSPERRRGSSSRGGAHRRG